MLILLYGPDSYRRTQKLKKYIEVHREKNPSATIERFDLGGFKKSDATEAEFQKLIEFGTNRSLFSGKNLAILENVWSSGSKSRKEVGSVSTDSRIGDFKKFIKVHLNSDDFKIIISEEKSPPPNLKFLLKKPAIVEKLDSLKSQEFKSFIKKEAGERGINLTSSAVEFLVKSFESDAWGLITELEKLQWLGPVPSNEIDVKKLITFGDYSESENVFNFIKMFDHGGGLSARIVELERLFFAREEPAKIFNFLASRNYLPKELLGKLADYDVAVKSGKLDYEEVLVDLAIS